MSLWIPRQPRRPVCGAFPGHFLSTGMFRGLSSRPSSTLYSNTPIRVISGQVWVEGLSSDSELYRRIILGSRLGTWHSDGLVVNILDKILSDTKNETKNKTKNKTR